MIGQNWPRGRHPPAQDLGGVAVWSTLREGVRKKILNFKIFK